MALILNLIFLLTKTLSAIKITPNAFKLYSSFTRNCELVYINDKVRYGLKATKDIHYGDTIMIIPPIYLLSSFEKYPWSGKFKSSSAENQLTVRLLFEKFVVKENSNRKLLIDSLPSSFSSIFSISDKEKSKFFEYFGQETSIFFVTNCTSDYGSFIKTQDKSIKNCSECLNYNNYLWACQAVLTRSYDYYIYDHYLLTQGKPIVTGENTKGSALIFGADMFNHYPRPGLKNNLNDNGVTYVGEPAHIKYKADRIILAGEEVFTSYGSKGNLELYLIHGFIIENNPDDFGIIGILSDKNDCERFIREFKFCEFFIKAKELSVEVVNYLFYRITGTKPKLKKIFDVIEKREKGIFRTENLVTVFTLYKHILVLNSLSRCKGEVKTGKNFQNIDLLERLCQENHKLFMSHIQKLDHFILSIFYNELIKT